MEKGKTIKQLADEMGVSKQAVQKRMIREPLYTNLKPYIDTVGGIKYIAYIGENLLKQAFSDKECIHVADNLSIDKSGHVYSDVYSVLQATIDSLQGQLEVKDKQIEQLQEALEKEREHSREQAERMAILADQAQQLQLAQIHPQLTAGAVEAPREKKRWFDFFSC